MAEKKEAPKAAPKEPSAIEKLEKRVAKLEKLAAAHGWSGM